MRLRRVNETQKNGTRSVQGTTHYTRLCVCVWKCGIHERTPTLFLLSDPSLFMTTHYRLKVILTRKNKKQVPPLFFFNNPTVSQTIPITILQKGEWKGSKGEREGGREGGERHTWRRGERVESLGCPQERIYPKEVFKKGRYACGERNPSMVATHTHTHRTPPTHMHTHTRVQRSA